MKPSCWDRNFKNSKKCIICGNKFYVRGIRRQKTAKYCSVKCKAKDQKGKTPYNIGNAKTEEIKCKKCGKKFTAPLWETRKYCSHKCYLENNNIGEQVTGKLHWKWKGGITPENQKLRSSRKSKDWRKAVFKRDNYTCQECGVRGGKLVADHIKQWAFFPKLRFNINNGRVLCEKCHEKTPTFRNNNKKIAYEN